MGHYKLCDPPQEFDAKGETSLTKRWSYPPPPLPPPYGSQDEGAAHSVNN